MQVFYKHICFIHTYVVSSTAPAARESEGSEGGICRGWEEGRLLGTHAQEISWNHTNSALIY